MAKYEIIDRRGLTEEQEAKAWTLYETNGNMADVARQLGVGYHSVRAVLSRDPMRLEAIRATRAEEMARRWEVPEQMAARIAVRSLSMLEDLMDHIDTCVQDGKEYTDLCFSTGENKLMTPNQARQWLVSARVLDTVQKLGFTGAKIAEGMRLLNEKNAMAVADTRDPSSMSDDEMRALARELTNAGLSLPPGLQQWVDAHPQRRLATGREE